GVPGKDHHEEPQDPPLPIHEEPQPDEVPQQEGQIEEAQAVDRQILAYLRNVLVAHQVEEKQEEQAPEKSEQDDAGVAEQEAGGSAPLVGGMDGAKAQQDEGTQQHRLKAPGVIRLRLEHPQELPVAQGVGHQDHHHEDGQPALKQRQQQERQQN